MSVPAMGWGSSCSGYELRSGQPATAGPVWKCEPEPHLAGTNMCRSGYCVAFGDRAAVAKTSPALLRSRVDEQWW